MADALVAWRQSFAPSRTLWLVGLGVAVSLLGDVGLYIVLPTHTQQAGIALGDVGLMLSANRLIRIFLNSPFGILVERIPRRRMMVPSLFVGGFSSLLYTVPGFWPLLIGRLLWGTAWAGIWLGGSTAILDISTDQNRGRFIGRYQMWYFIGGGGSALLGGVLTDWLGYSTAFRVCAAITLAMALAWWLFLPETRPQSSAAAGDPIEAGLERAPLSSPGTPAQPFRWLPVGTAVVLLGLNWLIFLGILGATLALLLEERIGETVVIVGLLIPLASFTGALSASQQVISLVTSPLAGWWSDRRGDRWGLVVFAMVLGIGALALTAVGTGIVIVIAIMASAVATSVLQTQVMTLTGDYTDRNRRGRVLGVLNTVGDLGSAAGPLLAYALIPLIDLSGLFWVATVVLAVAFPWTLWVARRETRQGQALAPSTHHA